MSKVIKSLKGNDYFVGLKKIGKVNYEISWSMHIEEAYVFDNMQDLNMVLALLQNANDNEDEFIVKEVQNAD